MIETFCTKIGGIWCYFPKDNLTAVSVVLGAVVILLLVIWLSIKKFN